MSSETPPRRLAGRIAPQRSTQYAQIASALALPELLLSPFGPAIAEAAGISLADQPYLLVTLQEELSASVKQSLYECAAVTDWYEYYDELDSGPGPWLRPIEAGAGRVLPPELVEARRYRGKTNELFARVLINLARWAHGDNPRCLLDPLMGGGTLVFIALTLGLHAAGIEQQRSDVESTDRYLDSFLDEAGIKHRRIAERSGGVQRYLYQLPREGLRAALVRGSTDQAPALLANLPAELRPDLVAADLPYGIQHEGPLEALLLAALPAWQRVAQAGAVLALAWDATRLPRPRMVKLVEQQGFWTVKQGGAWELLAHPVDRVIRRRDVVVAIKRGR